MLSRLANLAETNDEIFASPSVTPVGPATYERFMAVREFDFWMHERDCRTPLGMPTDNGGAPAEMALTEVQLSIGYIAGPFEAPGATVIKWNPDTRRLETAWTSPLNFARSVCAVSAVNELLYCWGARNGQWTMEAVEWHTGHSAFHYVLGDSEKFNSFGAPIAIAPNGAIDCSCVGGLGLVRVQPRR